MGIRPGYKQTELGVIPEEWEVLRLKEIISKLQLGGNYPNRETCAGPPLIKMGNIGRGAISLEKIEYISDADTLRIVDRLSYGDVLFNTRNTLELVGKVAIWRNELPLAYFNSNIMKITFDDEIVSSNEYANYLFNSYITIRQLRDVATGTTSVAAIYTRDLLKISFVICPAVEQIKIARTLSDIDSIITSIEKQTEKKKLIKQGVMQELLTGKRRLPGFSREWETKRLGDLFSLQYGKPMKESDRVESGVIPVYGSNGVVGYTFTELTSCPTIIVGRKGAAGSVHHSPTGCWPIDTTFYIEFDDYTESLFYYYLLQCAGLDRIKSDSAVPGLNRADAYALMITVPSKEERIQIAEILLSIDQEITYLTNSLDKHKLLKQAMMQELLTGRIRLI